ncbi:MAG: hypothetical protein ABIT38_23290 [Gemmatimonadaceae bacterium]
MPIIQTLAAAVGAWKSMYSDSKVLPTIVTSIHLGSLLVAGGLALSADRATIRSAQKDDAERRRHLTALGATHRPVLIALTVLFLSGLALTAADLETFLASPVYWIKGGVIVLLLINGLWMTRTEGALRASPNATIDVVSRRWRALRLAALSSLVLWMTTLVLGVALVNAA